MEILGTLYHLFDQALAVNSEPRARPGLLYQEIESTFSGLRLAPPASLMSLYEWHNGIDNLNAFLSFLPLEGSVAIYKGYQELTEQLGFWGWKQSMFPVLDENANIQLCIDCSSGALLSVCLENEVSVRQVAAHYESYVQALTEAFRLRAYAYNDWGYIEADPVVWRGIAEAHGVSASWLATGV